MSTPSAKRRRRDSASKTLSKPFVSPFKTPLKRRVSKNITADLGIDSNLTDEKSNPANTDSNQRKTKTFISVTTPLRSQLIPQSSPKQSYPSSDPETTAFLKTQRALETRLRTLNNEIDTISQALKIESSDTDVELRNLTDKWKTASREAAEELFGGVRDRVNRMGGVGAWRDARRRQEQWKSGGFGFDDGNARGGEGSGDGDGEEGDGDVSEGEKERRRAEVEDQVDTREVNGEGKLGTAVEEGADDDVSPDIDTTFLMVGDWDF